NRHHLAVPDDPNLIHPGQVFTLPPVSHSPHASTEASDGDETVTVEAGDSFWSIGRTVLADVWERSPTDPEVAAYTRQLIDHNRDGLTARDNPDLIHPGQQFQLPPVP